MDAPMVGPSFGTGKDGILTFDWVDIRAKSVLFVTDKFGSTNAPMNVGDFRLPFRGMIIKTKKPATFGDCLISTIWLIEMQVGKQLEWRFRSPDMGYAVTFRILNTGELDVAYANQGDTIKQALYLKKLATGQALGGEFFEFAEKWLYNFVYDLVSTIDSLNHSVYVVTNHTRKYGSNERLPNAQIERRIKIKKTHTESQSTGHGTKHRYKYRVRGHWREMESGKKVWVTDHVRGGDGTIFISKEYEF